MMWTLINVVRLLILIESRNLMVNSDVQQDPSLEPNILQEQKIPPDRYFGTTNDSGMKDQSMSRDDGRLQRRYGHVSSPFFFLCHSPRPGEPTDVGIDDVKVSLTVTGEKKFDAGYEPHTVYEMSVSSNVQLDGFLLTGIHAITKEFMDSNHLHLPPSVSSKNSAGTVCAFLHSHISKRPRSKISLMWMSPPSGTGCVAFLATGSLHGSILFKDLIIKEVCEKEKPLGELKRQESILTSKNEAGFVFRDDFEDMKVDSSIWGDINNGSVEKMPFHKHPGMSLMFNGNTSYIQTLPMDFSNAKHFQFTLGPGRCDRRGKVRISFGSVSPLPEKLRRQFVQPDTEDSGDAFTEGSIESSGDHLNPVERDFSDNGIQITDSIPNKEGDANYPAIGNGGDDSSSILSVAEGEVSISTDFVGKPYAPLQRMRNEESDEYETLEGSGKERVNSPLQRMFNEENSGYGRLEGSGEGSGGKNINVLDTMLSDQAISQVCSHWEEVDSHKIPEGQEVHTKAIPNRFQRKGICIQWKVEPAKDSDSVGTKEEEEEGGGPCWSLDNIAVVTKESKSGPIVDDFDPIDPTNWHFFPGGHVQETCGSEGNSLSFDGTSDDSWASTRQIDLSEVELNHDAVIHEVFSSEKSVHGWHKRGAAMDVCEGDSNILTFYKEGKREICSPFLDGGSFGVVKILGGVTGCSSSENSSVTLSVERYGKRTKIRDILFRSQNDVIVIPMTSALQQDGIKICLEQFGQVEGENAWNIKEIFLLPWMPSNPQYFLQVQMNLRCGYTEGKVDIEASSDGGRNWWSLHRRCIPGRCEGQTSAITPLIATGIDSGWTLVTLPLPYIALTPKTKLRIRQLEQGNSIWRPSWAIDYIYIGKCPQGCHGHGQCYSEGKCKCEYGYVGESCEISERQNPVYISEPFMGNIDTSANILEVSGGVTSYQCGIVGSGQAAVFKGRELRYVTTVDLDTTEAHLLQFHFRAGTVSNVGKCPGPDKDSEGVYVHYSCSGGATWHLLQTLLPKRYKEPSHINIVLPAGARNTSCRFQIWQAEHSGSGRDMWAIDDLTVTSQRFNTIELTFEDHQEANSSLRFHLGQLGNSCGRNQTLIFSGSSSNGLFRFLETKSVGVGPSYMMQFDLVIGCDASSYSEEQNSTVVLEYSLNHGLTWKLVQRPCTPSTPGCESHFTRGTVYHASEFYKWKRATLRLPKHTWSPTTRLRLRQIETSDVGLPWSIDNVYIGHQCDGLCSGHGYCTTKGCRCDDEFHGQKCLPLHKLDKEINADFDKDDHIDKYSFQVIGGNLAAQFEGCGTVVSGNNLYFGTPGIRHFETDDINSEQLHSIIFYLVIGGDHGLQRACQSSREFRASAGEEEVSFGSVVLEYSADGGISWDLLKEMIRSEYRKPKQFHVVFEDKTLKKSKETSGVIRFRLWQPKHNAEDQWSIDNFIVKPAVEMNTLQADFREDAAILSPWLSSTKFSQKKYCQSEDLAQVMDSSDPLRMAVTNRLSLSESDIISFQISVGCKDIPNGEFPVRLEFSRDGGNSWQLLKEGCLPRSLNCKGPEEPSIYWPGHHGPWQRVLIPVDHRLSHGDVQIRWIQDNPGETTGGEFALRDLYIGPPCNYSCMGHGTCTVIGLCKCAEGYSGNYCGVSEDQNNAWLRDGFEKEGLSSDFWENADGAVVAAGCNPDHLGNVMFFSGDDHRFITTRQLDTRNVKYLVFDLQIGANNYESRCQKGESPRDNVVVQFSIDNVLSWQTLQEFEPVHTINRIHPFFIPLPRRARTKQTRFRWWQAPPHMLHANEGKQAEWQLDNVMVMANESLPLNIVEDFSSNSNDNWFMTKGSERKEGCGKADKSLVFTGHSPSRYAETWDFEVNEATVLQFDIMPGCETRKVPTDIHVEYSTNNGKTWHLVKDKCYPPNSKCEMHDLPSIYSSKAISDWTRITLNLPENIEGERTRLMFKQKTENGEVSDLATSWAIDNIFIGDSCPWMCSGQGYCHEKKCVCDEGFFGEFCVPSRVLPCEAIDTFNEDKINSSIWRDVQGAEISNRCGTLVSRSALVFFKDDLRYATTSDLDMTAGQFIQFTLLMGCQGNTKKFRPNGLPEHSDDSKSTGNILVQFSTNGGITWEDLKIIEFHPQNDAAFISIELCDFPDSRTNATRFRLWQPNYHKSLSDIWAIDNLFIGGAPVNPNVLYEDFNADIPVRDAWIDWPAGRGESMCGSFESRSAIVFGLEEGEHTIYTKDLSVDEHSVVQFDIRVGCANVTMSANNVTLEFSTDYGLKWTPVRVVKPLYDQSLDYLHELHTPTVYYPNAARGWKRIIIPLSDVPICGNVRFRWWQGYYHSKETSEEWALDNIYIGPSCRRHCMGHGYCINGDNCDCDENYDGDYCGNSIQNDQEILEDFEDNDFASKFTRWSGADVSTHCDVLSGENLLFWQQGERMLVTKDLDLSHGSVVQFYLRLACSDLEHGLISDREEPIILQFSKNGGIAWNLISKLSKDSNVMEDLPNTRHFTISLPESAKTNSTRIRWWQPSQDGKFYSQWAIDQIYIGSTALGLPYFYDSGTGTEWLLRPGSKVEKACSFEVSGIHFSKNNGVRFAETPDIITERKTFIQYDISIGCKETNHCYDVFLEYSIDHGKTWHLVREECLPSDPDCPEFWASSIMTSDIYTSLTQITLSLPPRARSKLARFRFGQKSPWDSQHSWFVSRIYIGDDCPQRCSGRGFCEAGKCSCHEGWTGTKCEERLKDLPEFIADDFTAAPLNSMWKKVVGAKISEICGPIASGPALHFYGGCNRLLETVDIDLREALFIQFDLQTGCLNPMNKETASGDNSILVQISCNAGITWSTLRKLPLIYHHPKYVWIEIPTASRCLGGRVRWWQPGSGPRSNLFDWALDSVIVGGKVNPPSSISLTSPDDLAFPLWLRGYNTKPGMYCNFNDTVEVLQSTPSEPAIAQTTDIQITPRHSIHFRLALGCGALWDNSIEPVSLQYTKDFGRTWRLVRELCLPFNSTFCTDLHDESIFYAPQEWQYYVFPLEDIGPSKYIRFRWIQNETADVMGTHKWALRDVYIGRSCPHHCLGRGFCINQKCICDKEYSGEYCENIIINNVPYIKDTFKGSRFLPHWQHIQGALLAPGCGEEIEEPPAATFQGPYTRALKSKPVDTRSARFVLFTAQIGTTFGRGLCRKPDERIHNVFLQYSINGGIKWYLLRELDHALYRKPHEDYILIPRHAMTPATVFRFWQPRMIPTPPAWALDDVFIGGSEIGTSQLLEAFNGEPTVSEWLFAPHSQTEDNYCEKGDNGSLVWQADHHGHRAITTQELLIQEGHILQFKISVGCQQTKIECYNGPQVQLRFSKEGGAKGWDLVRDSCLPETSPDPDCFPYTFHGPSKFTPDVYSSWTRVTIPLPEKTWSSTTQLRWVQDAGRGDGQVKRILPWALDDVYVGMPCEMHCRGHGDCVQGRCVCDPGYEGNTCDPHPSHKGPLPTSLIDGFEGGVSSNWAEITGGNIGLGCNSLAPYGHGKHLYFNGCGTRQAITYDLDTRRASKVMFVLRIGSHDEMRSCRVDLSDPKRAGNKGVVFQFSPDNGITWATIDVHNPLDYRKARRVAYSLPKAARQNGVQLRWWQPDHDGLGSDQWALDNVEIVLAQRKPTHQYETHVYHQEDL